MKDGVGNVPGWRFCRESDNLPGWGIWVIDDGKKLHEYDDAIAYQERRERESLDKARFSKLLGEAERSLLYKDLLSQLGLSNPHRAELVRRGLIDSQIDECGFKTWRHWPNGKPAEQINPLLAGVGKKNALTTGNGIFLPAYDPSGRIMGGQLLADDDFYGKYRWVSSASLDDVDGNGTPGSSPHLQNGELPLFTWKLDSYTEKENFDVWLCEGGLKSAIAHIYSGNIFIGAAGGLFGSSPETLASYIQQIGARRLILAPDAGTIENRSVAKQNTLTLRLLQVWGKLHGFEVLVAWWGQGSKHSAIDIDEMLVAGRGNEIEFITPEQFYDLSGKDLLDSVEGLSPNRVGMRQQRFPVPVASQEQREILEYLEEERRKTWVEMSDSHRYILDTSIMGSGKSHTVGEMRTGDFAAFSTEAIIYLTSDPRNATTETLRDWAVLEGRHDGLVPRWVSNSRGGQDLQIRRRQIGSKEATQINANCDRAELAAILAAKNIAQSSDTVCTGCIFKASCAQGKGEFDYLAKRMEVLKGDRFIAHPASINPDALPPGSRLFIDESSRLEWVKTYVATVADIAVVGMGILSSHTFDKGDCPDGLIDLWEIVSRLWDRLVSGDLSKPEFKYGMSHADILKYCLEGAEVPQVDHEVIEFWGGDSADFLREADDFKGASPEDNEALAKVRLFKSSKEHVTAKAQAMKLRWLPDFYAALCGVPGYQLHLDMAGLHIIHPNRELISVLKHQNVSSVMFLDATSKPDFYEQILGEKVIEIRQENKSGATIKFIQIWGNGRAGGYRRPRQASRQYDLIDEIKQREGEIPVMTFKEYARTGDSIWFSDSRGGNHLETANALIMDGIASTNLAAAANRYAALYGKNIDINDTTLRQYPVHATNVEEGAKDQYWSRTMRESVDEGFAQWYREQILAEFHQGVGRLRASRRPGEELTVYVLSDYPLDVPVELHHISEYIELDKSVKERVEGAIEAIKGAGQVTLKAIASMLDCSLQAVAKTPAWRNFRKSLKALKDNGYEFSTSAI